MNILFTSTYYLPYLSGMTVHIDRLAKGLSDRGHKITVVAAQHIPNLLLREKKEKIFVVRIPVLFSLHKGFIMPTYIVKIWSLLKNNNIVVISLPSVESFIVALLAFLQRKPIFCIYHCEVVLPNSLLNKIIQTLLDYIHWVTLLLSKKIIVYTNDYAEHSRLLPYFHKKTIEIFPPVPLPTGSKNTELKIKTKLPDKNRFVIGVAARFAEEKGFEYLLSAIPILEENLGSDFVIFFAGPEHPVGEEKYWSRMQPIIERYSKHIVFLGTILPEEMRSFYELIDVLVLPSVNSTEAFGLVQVESMLCGTPVVVTDLPGVRVPVNITKMGEIAHKKDAEDLAKKISEVLQEKKNYRGAWKNAQKIFSIEKSISAFENVFEDDNTNR